MKKFEFKKKFLLAKEGFQKRWNNFTDIFKNGDIHVFLSMFMMGSGQLAYKQWAKGFMYLFIQIAFIVYFILTGATDLFGFFTLGLLEGNERYGIEGDNSVVMLIVGILSILILILYIVIYVSNVKDVYRTQSLLDTHRSPESFKKEVLSLFDKNFY